MLHHRKDTKDTEANYTKAQKVRNKERKIAKFD